VRCGRGVDLHEPGNKAAWRHPHQAAGVNTSDTLAGAAGQRGYGPDTKRTRSRWSEEKFGDLANQVFAQAPQVPFAAIQLGGHLLMLQLVAVAEVQVAL
jgi:hypothetical protein